MEKRATSHSISILNIVTQPHSPEGYVALFESAYKVKPSATKIRGDTYAMIASMFRVHDGDAKSPLEGELFRFTEIELGTEWFNLRSAEAATEDEIKNIRIPEHLRPNLKRFRYIFYPDSHRFFFESKRGADSFSAESAQRVVQKFLESALPVNSPPLLTVTIEQSKKSLERILSMRELRFLTIDVHLPNGDDGGAAEKAILEQMEKERIIHKRVELRAKPGEAIEPSAETRQLAAAALHNGTVVGAGKTAEGRPTVEETVDHPVVEPLKKPAKKPIVEWFREVTAGLVQKVRNP